MAKVRFDLSMSLDGLIAGPNVGAEHPLGEGGEQLHDWVFGLKSWRERHGLDGGEQQGRDSEIVEEAFATTGAILMGKGMFALGEEPWGEEPPFHVPVFVVTHEERASEPKRGGTTYHFVNAGIEAALGRAREAAGDGDISIAGGADVVQQFLRAGAVDEFQLHVVPLLLGDGVRLLEGVTPVVERTRVVESPTGVAHLKYRVVS